MGSSCHAKNTWKMLVWKTFFAMAPGKRKAVNPAGRALEVAKPVKHGGARANSGPKRKGVNTPGIDASIVPQRRQASLSDLLGERSKKSKTATALADAIADAITWKYVRQDGGDRETMVEQRQKPRGQVKYDMKEGLAILLKKFVLHEIFK